MALNTGLSIGAGVLALLLYSIYTVVYNVYFHPLRSFPGPKVAAATKLVYVYNRLFGSQVRWTKSLHDRYGEVVRLAPDQLSFTSPEAWRDIYSRQAGARTGIPKDLKYFGPDLVGSNGITRCNDEDHARQRRILSYAFSDKALHEQEPLFRKHINVLVDKLNEAARAPSGTAEMNSMYSYCLFDIVGDFVFGTSLDLLEKPKYRPWPDAIFSSFQAFTIIPTINACYPWLGKLVQRFFIPSTLVETCKMHGNFVREHIDARLSRQEEGLDMWSYVLRHNHAGKGLLMNEMYAVGGNMMLGGTETGATLLSGLTYFLLTNPDKLAILTKEIREAFPDSKEVDGLRVAQLPYLRACLQEALRVYPPVPVGMPRLVPPGGSMICGKTVPAGTTVYVSQYAAYHSSAYFYEPDRFMPERWAEEPAAEFAADVRDVVEPFSIGPRNCIGQK